MDDDLSWFLCPDLRLTGGVDLSESFTGVSRKLFELLHRVSAPLPL